MKLALKCSACALIVNHLLGELAHKTAANALVDHCTGPVGVGNVTVNTV